MRHDYLHFATEHKAAKWGCKEFGEEYFGLFMIRGSILSWNSGLISVYCLSMDSIRLGGPTHGIVTKTVHKTLPGGGWGPGSGWVGE